MQLFPFLALVLLAGFFFSTRRKKTTNIVNANWSELTDTLFERHGIESYSESKLREILVQGSKKLGLRYGIVLRHRENDMQVLSHSSTSYWPFQFQTGSHISRDTLFCGFLNSQREEIMIDYASLTDWRRHPSYKNIGIEVYIGAYLVDSGQAVTISFFDTTPREHLFTRADKQFVKQLGTWVSSHIRGREMFANSAVSEIKNEQEASSDEPVQ